MSSRLERAETAARLLASRAPNSTGWVRVDCPFCIEVEGRADHRRSLGLQASSGMFRCFRCGTKGRARGFTSDAEGSTADEGCAPSPLPEGFTLLGEGDGATALATARARRYLSERGVPEVAVRGARIGYAVDHRGVPRVVVPVFGADTSLRGWVARALARDVVPKYLNASGSWASRTVFNEGALLRRTDAPLMIVEGVFDALPYWPDAAAMLGKGVKGEQFKVLLQSRRPLVVCYDGDAHVEGWALASQLQLYGARAAAVRLPAATDPNTVDVQWLRAQVAQAARGGS